MKKKRYAKRWYVVAYPAPKGWKHKLRDKVWTVSRNPLEPGWQTDAATMGYGLTFSQAFELAMAANEKYERRRAGTWEIAT